MPTRVFLVVDTQKSGLYIKQLPESRAFVGTLSKSMAGIIAHGADDAWPAEGDAAIAVFASADACLRAVEELQSEWDKIVATAKATFDLTGKVPLEWPAFRAMVAPSDEVYANRSDNLQVLETLKAKSTGVSTEWHRRACTAI